jgi:hypothetical protein
MRRVLEKEEMAYFTLLVDMWKRSIEEVVDGGDGIHEY